MARVDQTGDWRDRHAPSLAEFESLAIDAYAKLPDGFRAHTGNVAIIVADFPDDDIFEDMGLETPFDLLGLFEGRGLSERFTIETGELPTGSCSTGVRSSITGPRTTRHWATSSLMY
jgi:predicted Zn-dependent protease with MMP-like domain